MSSRAIVIVVPASTVKKLLRGGYDLHDWANEDRVRARAAEKRRAKRRKAALKRARERKAEFAKIVHIKFVRGRWVMGRRAGWCAGYGRPRRMRRSSGYTSRRTGPRCGSFNMQGWTPVYAATLAEVNCPRCKELHAKDIERVRKDVEDAKARLAEIEAGSLSKKK